MDDAKNSLPEPWLRGTHLEVPAVARAVLHALELAREDLHRWCAALSNEQLQAQLAGIPSVAFQLRHIAGSADRLLTYAEGNSLNEIQLVASKAESENTGRASELLAKFDVALDQASQRIRALALLDLSAPRTVGKKQLPTTLGGLLVHLADHTQRHVGQAITTAKLVSTRKTF
jgi:uncharacterized damage-inducible protein DinB